MPSTDPLQAAVQKWNSRFRAQTIGASPEAVAAVRQADLQRVAAGGTSMSTQEALAAIQSASQGRVANPPKPASGSLFNILGNTVKDISGIATGAAIGTAHLVSHPARDIKGAIGRVEDIGKFATTSSDTTFANLAQKYGLEGTAEGGRYVAPEGELSKVRDILRMVNFLPLASTSLNVTRGRAGIADIIRHPVSTAIDIGAVPDIHGLRPGESPNLVGMPFHMGSAVRDSLQVLGSIPPAKRRLGTRVLVGRGGAEFAGTAAEAAARGQITRDLVRRAADGMTSLYFNGKSGVKGTFSTKLGKVIKAGKVAEKKLATTPNLTPIESGKLKLTALEGRKAATTAQLKSANFRNSIPGILKNNQLTQEASRAMSQYFSESRAVVAAPDSLPLMYENFIREDLPESLQPPPAPPFPPPAAPTTTPTPTPPTPAAPPSSLRDFLTKPESAAAPPGYTPIYPNDPAMEEMVRQLPPDVQDRLRRSMQSPAEQAHQELFGGGSSQGRPEEAQGMMRYTPPPGLPPPPTPPTPPAAGPPPAPPPPPVDLAKLSFQDAMDLANKPLPLSGMTEAQQKFMLAYGHPDPAIRARLRSELDPEHMKVINIAESRMGHSAFIGLLHNYGVLKTTTDMQGLVSSVPDSLKQTIMGDPEGHSNYVLADPFDLENVLPDHITSQLPIDHTAMWMPRDIYAAMYGKYGIWNRANWPDWFKPGPGGGAPATGPLHTVAPYTRFFKGAVFGRPATILHIAISNAILMTGEGIDVWTPSKVLAAYRMWRAEDLPAYLAPHYNVMNAPELFNAAAGTKLGKLAARIPNFVGRMTDHVTKVEKAMIHMQKYDDAIARYRVLNPGASTFEAEQAARMVVSDSVNRVMMTFDYATPFERQVMKQIFPFYSFQKHVFNYLSKLPANHPYITDFITQNANREMEDAKTGLPAMFQEMFTFGNTDSNGNVKAIDIRSFNPFRSFYNDFTLTGLASSANPIIDTALQRFGINSQGAPSLYPLMTVDPQTGGLTAVRPSTSLTDMASNFFPELRTIDGFLGINTRIKALYKQDPSAARAYLWNTLGIPITQTINVPGEVARHEKALFTVAQRDVTAYLKTGDYSWINGYLQVPFHGKMWTPSQLHDYYTRLQQTSPAPPGASEKGLISKKVRAPAGATPTTAAGVS